ncbi:MAG: DUF4911 domain-containing protein [Syntrophomonadaceae bacterium]|nr:DUF4911 domain-containing protein [Syntrophomonadaceae bacterium]
MINITGEIYVKINPQNIDILTKFIEAYDNLGIVSTVDRSCGLVVIRGTVDTYPELMDILKNLPFEVEFQ